MPTSRLPTQPWYSAVTIDLFVKVLKNSVFHPFVASLVPLCLRAAETPWTQPAMINSICWAAFICIIWALGPLNDRIAYGPPREVDHEEETIVITGGASGLGRCIAETYAIQGAAVAVLDVKPVKMANFNAGVKYYECDIGDRSAVKKVWAKIVEDVRDLQTISVVRYANSLQLGTPTVLINNAGIVHGKTMLQLSSTEIQEYSPLSTLLFLTIEADQIQILPHQRSLPLPPNLPLPPTPQNLSLRRYNRHSILRTRSRRRGTTIRLFSNQSRITSLPHLPLLGTRRVSPNKNNTSNTRTTIH